MHPDEIDYDQYLNPDPAEAQSWTFLPTAQLPIAPPPDPPTHRILLVPADPHYSPTEDELWPVVHQAVLDSLAAFPEVRDTIQAAVRQVIEQNRGWSNPHPYTEKQKRAKRTRPTR